MGDDGTSPVTIPNGTNVQTAGGYDYQVANAASTGTTVNKLACDNGSGAVVICAHTTSTTNQSLGSVIAGAGTTGNGTLCTIGFCNVIFDNQTTAEHYAIASTSADGELHDAGASLTAGQPNYFIWTANAGMNTPGLIRVLIGDDFLQSTNSSNGKGITLNFNGSSPQPVANVNSSTPSAPAGDQNCTVQTSNSGNTTSESCYISPLFGANIVDGLAPATITTGASATLGGTYKSGYTVNQEATAGTGVTYTLPTAAAGLQYCINNGYNGSAADTGILTLATSASGQFIFNLATGTLTATGGNLTSAGAAGDSICVRGDDATHWTAYAQFGTWTVH